MQLMCHQPVSLLLQLIVVVIIILIIHSIRLLYIQMFSSKLFCKWWSLLARSFHFTHNEYLCHFHWPGAAPGAGKQPLLQTGVTCQSSTDIRVPGCTGARNMEGNSTTDVWKRGDVNQVYFTISFIFFKTFLWVVCVAGGLWHIPNPYHQCIFFKYEDMAEFN